ncbi:XRE family transcriptional regulator [Agrobacterium rhizogenes]|uniref:Xre family DNA-binding protein n=1 Tax=Rhizobium rhizogenes NBRC 13257 TaxID=1220581 RepID=A0AA87U7S6_RHIRH|nr:XRE family transcriptional regulator [Rhizobium rhizogenes]NTG65095.1 XRE family transcriptional regulator [Rhizobium rhizogenes]NTG71546.1 XRE family transcriptional regulator [Rhizobium rhizogenes]NTG84445.1 XRE family transcriptional regulator [Rhizobium rhizogenes]NTG90839.1 XRE family transcriptional regulator [Rhizobium rhizogenes]NTH29473.1 XRE family transcriptional regulator [Rhizobium rhizogenes]
MTIGKLFIGRKVRELRDANKATQSQFAERIGISTSYLNQIENNQRPVSATVLVALAEKFQINVSELSSGEGDRLLSALTEALTDPLFENLAASVQELKLITQGAPNLARALIRAHQGFKRNSEQLVSLSDSLGQSASLAETTSYEEVRDFFHFVDNYIHSLDIEAERLATEIGLGDTDGYSALTHYLKTKFRIEVKRSELDNDALRSFDRSAGILYINRYAPAATRDFQIAFQVAQLHASNLIDLIARDANFRTVEAMEICKIGLQNYFAGALLLPYGDFLSAANTLRHDLDLLAARFGASLEQVCHRLSTLQRPGNKGVPVFFARIDRAGNITKRHSSTKLQFARFGAACPLWNVHEAFEAQGRIIRQLAETPDGVRFLCLATQITKAGAGYHSPHPRYAIAFGCEISYAHAFVYSDDLDLSVKANFAPIGISCRICERLKCPQRAVPPLMRKLHVDHDKRTVLPYTIEEA